MDDSGGDVKPKWFYDEMYKENFYFCIGWKPKDFEQYMFKYYNHAIDCAMTEGRCVEWFGDGKSGQIIWVRYKSGPKMFLALCHEAIHAAYHLLDRRGVKLCGDNHEPLTYLVEHIIRKAIS